MYRAKEAYQNPEVARAYNRQRFSSPLGRLTDKLEMNTVWRAVKASGTTAPASVLDMPCGTGRLTKYLAQRGFQVSGVDISPAMLDVARAEVEKVALSGLVQFHEGNGEALAFADGSFDLVISLRLFGHLPPDIRQKVIRELARVSRGNLILAWYQKGVLQEVLRRNRRLQKGITWNVVTVPQMDQELSDAGLQRIKAFPLLTGISETLVVLAARTRGRS